MEREESPTERAVFNLATAWQESEAKLAAATARAEKAEALYAKAWAECEAHRDYPTDDELGTGDPENENVNIIRMARLGTAMDDHDAKRREAGL